MRDIIIALVVALLGALGAWITKTLIPYIQSRTELSTRETINEWIKIAVTAAEQIFTGSGKGEVKYFYVEEFLANKGITLDEADRKALIESTVQRLKAGVL